MGTIILKLILLALLMPSFSLAQPETTSSEVKVENVEAEQSEEEQAAHSTGGRVEKLEVTGSYIRRSDIEGPSPVVTIDREAIEKSGFNSVGSLLRRSTVSPFGGDADEVNLKGIGSSRTLVLVNGQRAPASGDSFTSGNVDPNLVPLAAVERIEILKDGASATYGSDALGGVVNIITRKNLQGFAFAARYNLTDWNGGDGTRTSVAYGSMGSSGSFLTSLQHIYTQGYRRSDIPRLEGSVFDYRRSTNYRNFGSATTYPIPGCTTLDSRGRCEEDLTPEIVYKPYHKLDWVTDFEYDIWGDTSFYTTVILGGTRSETELFPATLSEPGVGTGIGFTNAETPVPWNSLPNFTPGAGVLVFHRINELPNRRSITEASNIGVINGLKGYVGESDWMWDVTINNQFNYVVDKDFNYGLFAPVKNAMVNGTYDPFGAARDTTGFTHDLKGRARYQVNWAEAKANGELGNLLGFDWATAFGVSAAHFEYKDERDSRALAQEIMGLSGIEGNGERQLYATFAEFSALLDKSFELQVALRQDMYSDFGETFNPRVAMRYQPINEVMFRTSWGTGFQAPILQNVYGPQLEGFVRVVDQTQCNLVDDCTARSYSARQGSNPNLKEETSENFNFGVVFQPKKSFNFSVDYWRVVVEDTIGADFRGLLQAEALNPTAPAKYGASVTRDPVTNEIQRIEALLQNIGKEEANGLDVSASVKVPLEKGDLTLGTEHTYMFHYFETFYEELGREQVLGQSGLPRWRNNTSIRYDLNNWGFLLVARTIAQVETADRRSRNPAFTQFDMTLDYDPEWAGRFQIGALNAFKTAPARDPSLSRVVDSTLVQPERQYFFTYREDF